MTPNRQHILEQHPLF